MTRRDAALIALLYGAWLVAAYLLNALATGASSPQALLDNWVRFDAIYFRAIAEYGYDEASRRIRPEIGFPFLAAFFPLLPLLIRLCAPLVANNFSAASVLVPQALALPALWALFRLVLLDFPRPVAWFTVVSLVAFPTFYFLATAYSEGLFLLLVVLALWFYRTGRAAGAGIAGALAASARIMGAPFLWGAFVLDAAADRFAAARRTAPSSRSAAAASHPKAPALLAPLLLVPLGLLAYAAYLQWAFGDALLFLQGHGSAEWKVGFDPAGPVKGLLLPFATLIKHPPGAPEFRANLFNASFLYAGIATAAYAWRKLPRVYNIYAVLALLLPMLTGSIISMPRYLLVSVPFFVGMGLFWHAHPRARVALAALALGGLLATYLFFRTVFLG